MDIKVGDTLLIGCDFSGGKDIGIVTVAKRVNGEMKFINVSQGEDSVDFISETYISKKKENYDEH